MIPDWNLDPPDDIDAEEGVELFEVDDTPPEDRDCDYWQRLFKDNPK
jgi:hypothetical protein